MLARASPMAPNVNTGSCKAVRDIVWSKSAYRRGGPNQGQKREEKEKDPGSRRSQAGSTRVEPNKTKSTIESRS